MPSVCDTSNSGNYAIRHNPEPYYLANIGQTLCNAQDVALGASPGLSAKFTFVTPNLCHDMHSNSCTGSSNVILQGDQWLQRFVPTLLNTSQYQAGHTVIFITWDEDNTTNLTPNQIPTVIIDPNNPHSTGHVPGRLVQPLLDAEVRRGHVRAVAARQRIIRHIDGGLLRAMSGESDIMRRATSDRIGGGMG